MIKNYFKIAWRNLWKNKAFSFINITGLAVGMCGAILIFTWVQNELSFDQFHKNKADLYKLYNRSKGTDGQVAVWDITASPVGPELQRQYPEVKSFCRVYWPTDRLFNYNGKSIIGNGLDVDKQFLTMFSFNMLSGNDQHALDDNSGIILTASFAKKIFGSESALNKMVRINDKDNYKVTGIIADLPINTQFQFDYLVSLAPGIGKFESDTWNNGSYNTYIQLQPGTDPAKLEVKLKGIMAKHDPSLTFDIFLHPLAKWHLYSRFENGKAVGGVIETVRLLLAIAILILLIACINFMNLSTAQSEKRGKEVGVRKVMGANRFSLIKQFLSESILISILAGALAMVLVQLLLPSFNKIADEQLSINYSNPYLWLGLVAFILITGLLAGSYPAFYLSSFKPVKVLKSMFSGKVQLITPRKLLVVGQFTIAIVLIIGTLIIYKQINYVQHRNNGYVTTNLVEHPMTGSLAQNYDLVKNELISSGAATAVSKTSLSVTVNGSTGSGVNWGNMDPAHTQVVFDNFATTGDFVKTFGFKLMGGRDIDLKEFPSDTAAVLINQAAAKAMGFKNPVGQTIKRGNQLLAIVGVINDFIIGSPYKPVDPMLVAGSKGWFYNTLTFKLSTNRSVAANLKIAGAIFKKYNPAYPFQYAFVDQEYADKFSSEQRTGTIALTFAALTIFISCLGLFGLAAYMAENRRKEIGIRKVLGASIINVMQLLTREFVILVIVSIIIATPIGWWAMNKWLQDYDYRITINWQTFAIAGAAAIVIAVITVSFQAGKAAMLNPVKSIKSE
jgi:putative ABC transport system permease protein